MEHNRAVSDSSILTTECSRCVAEDAEQGLRFYGERYGGKKEYSGFGSVRKGREEDVTGSTVVDSPDETGWRDLVKAVRRTWEEGKVTQVQASSRPVPVIVSPSRPAVGRVEAAPVTTVSVVPPPPPPPPPAVVTAHYNPVRTVKAPRTPEMDAASLDGSLTRWDYATPKEKRRERERERERERVVVRRVQREYQPVPREPVQVVRRAASMPRRSASNPPVADSAHLQRRLQTLQRTVHTLQDDKTKLEAERVSLSSENERYRQALESKDVRLQKLKSVKQQINTLSNLNKKGAEIQSRRQQAIAGLDKDIKNLFTEWQDTRVNPKNRTTLTAYRKPRQVWVY